MEEWRDVPGFEGLYQINIDTPEGRCRRFYKNGKVKELSNNPDKRGRLKWFLSKGGKQTNRQASVWIAITYPELVQNKWFKGAEIDHIDTDTMNNNPSNLRWVDRIGQMNNSLTKQHVSEGHLNHPSLSKWVIKLSHNNEILHFYPSTRQAERETGINSGNISKCCLGKKVKDKDGRYYAPKTAGGYIWKYA